MKTDSFLNFIEEDIEAKKLLLSTLPTKTKKNQKDHDSKVTSISKKYKEYESAVKKYIEVKAKSFSVKEEDKQLEEKELKVKSLKEVKFILNPLNTYFEKMCFDDLLYQIINYYDFNFSSLNEIINQFLDKFEVAGVKLDLNDLDYTPYVQEYMSVFLEMRTSENPNYDKVSETFEKIYWANPEIIQHLELNFRKLTRQYERHFKNYIKELQRKAMNDNKIKNYDDCLKQLKDACKELEIAKEENISDIINLAKEGKINPGDYFKDSKMRISTYENMMINPKDLEDERKMDIFHDNLKKLKNNLEEYNSYLKFIPLIENFKKEYEGQIPKDDKDFNVARANKNLKDIESKINKKESQLERIKKRITIDKIALFESKNKKVLNRLQVESVTIAKELYGLYQEYDDAAFKCKVYSILNKSFRISDVLDLYYSYDFYKKAAIKKSFEVETYEEILEYADSFNELAINPLNIILDGVEVFEENDIARVISNKHKLNNINLTEEVLSSGDLESIIGQINLLIRINKVEKSDTTIEKVWFISEVEKLTKKKEA